MVPSSTSTDDMPKRYGSGVTAWRNLNVGGLCCRRDICDADDRVGFRNFFDDLRLFCAVLDDSSRCNLAGNEFDEATAENSIRLVQEVLDNFIVDHGILYQTYQ
jgi:hypothetical protein